MQTLPKTEPAKVADSPQATAGTIDPLYSRRQLAIIAGGAAFLLTGAAGSLAWARANTGPRVRQTSFGTIEIRDAARGPRLAHASPFPAGHHGAPGGSISRQPGNHTWAEVVLLGLEVQNLTEAPVYLSPGQLRLRIGSDRMGVAPSDSGPGHRAVAAETTERFTISYLTPTGVEDIAAEFTDLWQPQVISLELPVVRRLSNLEARL